MDHRNLTLLTDLYELTMMQGYFKEKDANETVIFDMFYRTNPHGMVLPFVPVWNRPLNISKDSILTKVILNI